MPFMLHNLFIEYVLIRFVFPPWEVAIVLFIYMWIIIQLKSHMDFNSKPIINTHPVSLVVNTNNMVILARSGEREEYSFYFYF